MDDMVMIVAYVRRARRAQVGQALRQLESGWTESDVLGHGNAAGGHGVEHVRFEVLVPSGQAKVCTEAIERASANGASGASVPGGGGMVVVLPVLAVDSIAAVATNR